MMRIVGRVAYLGPVGIAFGLLCAAFPARAAEVTREQCLASSEQWIHLRTEGKLRAAREQLVMCSSGTCSEAIQTECQARLDEVNAAIPSVVPEALDEKGGVLLDVRVWMDGAPLVERIDGRAISVDPGLHSFTFFKSDSSNVERKLLVPEGARGVPVAVRFEAAPPAATTASAVEPQVARPAPPTDASNTEPSRRSPWQTVGYVAGGVGLVGIGVGAVFGGMAISQDDGAHCTKSTRVCENPQSERNAAGSATVSTIGFVAGGVLAAGGLTVILVTPSRAASEPTRSAWALSPRATPRGASVSLEATW